MIWAAAVPLITSVLSQASQKSPGAPQVETPVDRRMQSLQSDPANVIKAGKSQLEGMDPNIRDTLSPVLDEALKKATQQKMSQNGGQY